MIANHANIVNNYIILQRPASRHAGHGNEPRERMEDAEKRVLKRRKGHLAEHIEVTDEFLERMVKTNLLTPEMATIVDVSTNINCIYHREHSRKFVVNQIEVYFLCGASIMIIQ